MQTFSAVCPQCDASLRLEANTQVAEIITCTDCSTRLVVEDITMDRATVSIAPAVEEDWGE